MGRVLGMMTALALVGCGVAPAPGEGDQAGDVAATQSAISACPGLPDPGTCWPCSERPDDTWAQACMTLSCSIVEYACTPPIVSCGACGALPNRPFTQICTRADGSQVIQGCTPPRLPPPPPRLPALPN